MAEAPVIGRTTGIIALVFAGSALLSQQSQQLSTQAEASVYLDKSYSLSKNLNEKDRIWYLGDLLNISLRIAPGRSEALANELFEVTRRSQLDLNSRIPSEKNAVVAMSRFNPEKAMSRFREVEDPEQGVEANEDVRAHAARVIFPSYIRAKGLAGIPEVQQQAFHIGDTGAYPHQAIGYVIAELNQSPSDAARQQSNELFTEAMSYYNRKSHRILNEDSEFLALLQSAKPTIDLTLLHSGISMFIDHVKEKIATESSGKDATEIYTNKIFINNHVVSIPGENLTLLFQAFSILKGDIDPTEANELRAKYSVLKEADHSIDTMVATYVPADVPQSQLAKIQSKGLRDSLLIAIQNKQDSDPGLALKLPSRLTILSPDSWHAPLPCKGWSSLNRARSSGSM